MPRRNLSIKHLRFQPSGAGGCRMKKQYTNRQQAETAADIATAMDSGVALSVYQCPHCSQWHLTKAKRQKLEEV